MKNLYITPSIEVVKFNSVDTITASSGGFQTGKFTTGSRTNSSTFKFLNS